MKRIAINGLGRTGRLMLRRTLDEPNDEIEVVAINDIAAVQVLPALAGRLRVGAVRVPVADGFAHRHQ